MANRFMSDLKLVIHSKQHIALFLTRYLCSEDTRWKQSSITPLSISIKDGLI